jgi:hypothetical protein
MVVVALVATSIAVHVGYQERKKEEKERGGRNKK